MAALDLIQFRKTVCEYHHYADTIWEDVNALPGVKEGQRVVKVALPFLSLYKPLAQPISIAKHVRILTHSLIGLLGRWERGEDLGAQKLLKTTLAVAILVGTILAHPAALILGGVQSIVRYFNSLIEHISNKDCKEIFITHLRLVGSLLFLCSLFYKSLPLFLISLAIKIAIGCYQSWTEFQKRDISKWEVKCS